MKSQNTRGVCECCKRSNALIGAIYLSGVFPITLKDLKHILRSAIRETVKVVPMGGLFFFFQAKLLGLRAPQLITAVLEAAMRFLLVAPTKNMLGSSIYNNYSDV